MIILNQKLSKQLNFIYTNFFQDYLSKEYELRIYLTFSQDLQMQNRKTFRCPIQESLLTKYTQFVL